MNYTCSLPVKHHLQTWECSLDLVSYQPPFYEAIINGNGNSFHVIAGPQINGNFLCIPNWQIGCELSRLSDVFWNSGQLRRHLNETDTRTVAVGLSYLPDIGKSLGNRSIDPVHYLKRL